MLDGFRSRSTLLMIIACKISPNPMNQSYSVTQIIETTSTYDLIKLKSFCPAKETINMVKIHHLEWEKIIANETTDK